jgi:hypothetical protein
MLLHYARGVLRTRKIKNAKSKSWNIRYNRTLLYNQGLSIEQYKNIAGTLRGQIDKASESPCLTSIVYFVMLETSIS